MSSNRGLPTSPTFLPHSILGPTTLTGQCVRLDPLREEHIDGLWAAGEDRQIWTWMIPDVRTRDDMAAFVHRAIEGERAGRTFAFVVRLRKSAETIGSIRYLDIDDRHRSLEVGTGWYSPRVWRSAVNTEAHLLLFGHAFERWEAHRIMMKTDPENRRAQSMIRVLGGTYEGRLRNHRVRPNGTLRDSLIYSIISDEWPRVRLTLEERLRGKECPT